jgi:hypothetical protein
LAPYGRKEETIVDTKVRNTWQLNPDQLVIRNPLWNNTLGELVEKIKFNLGIEKERPVKFNLYKLLLYEKGGFFAKHRDTGIN